jgi:phosphopantothenoylcysteine decarboxylase/phosphopantothenate--cysteine ligase
VNANASQRLLVGITGGIAAYKAADLVRRLIERGCSIDVVMTEAACRFVTPATFQALSGRPVYADMWDPRVANGMAHIDLSRDKDAIVVAPATADFLAKLAHGLCDDLLSTLCVARDCPLVVAPAMNRQMWEYPATKRNVAQIERDGVIVLGPASGDQACGEIGMGRMLEPVDIAEGVLAALAPRADALAGVNVLVTAGPTFEPIDPVRGITNRSSGKMGYAVARAAIRAGAQVTLVSGPTALAAPAGARRIDVVTADEMFAAVKREAGAADMFIAVAAVSDYHPIERHAQKIKKNGKHLTLELAPNPDILAYVAGLAKAPFCIGFAAESEKLAEHAEAKRKRKKIPLLAANLAQSAIGADDNELTLFDDEGAHPLPRASKDALARELVHHAAKLYRARKPAR